MNIRKPFQNHSSLRVFRIEYDGHCIFYGTVQNTGHLYLKACVYTRKYKWLVEYSTVYHSKALHY